MSRREDLLSKRKWLNERGKELSKIKLIELADLTMCAEHTKHQDGKNEEYREE